MGIIKTLTILKQVEFKEKGGLNNFLQCIYVSICLMQLEKVKNIPALYQKSKWEFFCVFSSFPHASSVSNYSVIFEKLKHTLPE